MDARPCNTHATLDAAMVLKGLAQRKSPATQRAAGLFHEQKRSVLDLAATHIATDIRMVVQVLHNEPALQLIGAHNFADD